jgi:hypothetical protein
MYVEDEQGNWSVKEKINGMEEWFQHEEEESEDDNKHFNKKTREHSLPCTVVNIVIQHRKRNEDQMFLALLDTGARKSLGTIAAVKKAGLTIEKDSKCRQYQTAAGTFTTNKQT